ncbi:hypothetical protein KFL_009440030 [Klebsormidium nitens]|uniref:Uncharacterized protein n=1 Tax=Klebsormidium nitens TaxID=105231 RepID=A0A1Y1ISF6_KLENI|nr:hypothetical protein KFL_009440030 [Klebsormidium nitens]|eukprot:GAQ92201.1 hypothetical protein KFL_009440030 [Klebsormidium nitens]
MAIAKPLSHNLLVQPAFSTFQRLQCNHTSSRSAQATANHVRKGQLDVRESQRGTSREGEASARKAEVAEVNVGTCLLRFPVDLPAKVMQQQLESVYGPGLLLRASDSLAFSNDDKVSAGSYEYIHGEHTVKLDTKEAMEGLSKVLANLEKISRLVEQRRRRRWFIF